MRIVPLYLSLLTALFILSSSAYPKPEKSERDLYTITHLRHTLYLFDTKIDLSRDDIKERFEREFFQFLDKRGLLYIIVKRYFQYRRLIEEEIKRIGLHHDLIYLVIAESYLNPRAVSKAEAQGLWQFIKETGKQEGLIINDTIDERYDIVRSTQIALLHLKKLHEEFKDWFLACAAYNAGLKRVKEAIQNQNTKDFFDLYLPEETERYIFRIVALKEIFENRERYGIKVDEKDGYKELSIDSITIRLDKELHTSILASSMGLPYRAFRYLNLHMRKYSLPKGTYNVYFPREKREFFLKNLRSIPHISIEEK
ncbi:MAG: lytic transglycosylase domain-containing protein [Desulfobacterota bacterium]|nr:lytic transglycosylase domain-containing protein [Thermodesulfobacteriota bacterium]MDW8001550.1 lytic transglycosylase domain-containing protein [Deltaproteobacteria bacterium]